MPLTAPLYSPFSSTFHSLEGAVDLGFVRVDMLNVNYWKLSVINRGELMVRFKMSAETLLMPEQVPRLELHVKVPLTDTSAGTVMTTKKTFGRGTWLLTVIW